MVQTCYQSILSVLLCHGFTNIQLSQFANGESPSSFVHQYGTRAYSNQSKSLQSSRSPIIEPPSSFYTDIFSNKIERFIKSNVMVQIERTAQNERRISGELILNHDHSNIINGEHHGIGLSDLWHILTDYDNLSTHVPNLVESRIISGRVNTSPFNNVDQSKVSGGRTTKLGPRIYQRGAQRIWGFEFGADLTMDMQERIINLGTNHSIARRKCILDFKCVSSQFFSQFDGSWILEDVMASSQYGASPTAITTNVKYIVDVKPKGLVPVAALEWRIKEDVPTNMLGVVNAASKRKQSTAAQAGYAVSSIDWYRDETLSMYL